MEFPGGYLGCSRQVVPRSCHGWEVGFLRHRSVRQSLSKFTLAGMGERVGRGSGADWDKTRRARVRVTGIRGVRSLGGGQRIDAEGARSSSGVPSVVLKVGARLPRAAVLGVRLVELSILSCWISSTIIQLATLVLDKINLPVNSRFASAPDCQPNSPFEVKLILAWVFGRGRRPASSRLQAPM